MSFLTPEEAIKMAEDAITEALNAESLPCSPSLANSLARAYLLHDQIAALKATLEIATADFSGTGEPDGSTN